MDEFETRLQHGRHRLGRSEGGPPQIGERDLSLADTQGALQLVKTIYGLVIALWLISGAGMHLYCSRVAQGTAQVEEKRDLYLRQFENDDTVAQRIRETHWRSNSAVGGAYAAWIAAGVLIGVLGIRSQFKKAGKSFDA